jgi:hypothetical protein
MGIVLPPRLAHAKVLAEGRRVPPTIDALSHKIADLEHGGLRFQLEGCDGEVAASRAASLMARLCAPRRPLTRRPGLECC